MGEPLIAAYRRRFPHRPSLFFAGERRELETIIAPIVAQRRIAGGRDIVSLLLAERDDRDAALSDDDVRNEVVTLVLAGHETTATALTWAWYLLATHPAVMGKLHAELDAVLGDRDPISTMLRDYRTRRPCSAKRCACIRRRPHSAGGRSPTSCSAATRFRAARASS